MFRRTIIILIAAMLATTGLALGAAAHWDGTANGGPVPAHHVTAVPGGVQTFNLRPLLCASHSGLVTVASHVGYNTDETVWHAAVSHPVLFPAYDPATIPPAGAEGIDLPSINDVELDGVDTPPYIGPDLHTPSLTPGHGHHDSQFAPSDSAPANNDKFVDAFTPQIADHRAITAGGGAVLVAPSVVNPQAGGHPTPPNPGIHVGASDIGISVPVQDVNPQNGVEDCPTNHNGIPAGNDAPTGAGAAVGIDTSIEPTLNAGPAAVSDGNACIDVGDNDAETAFGGAFFMYSANGPPGPVATGANLFGCQMPPGFANQAGYLGVVRMADLTFPPNGASYTVCFDLNDDSMCTMNSQATPDAWDQCVGDGAGTKISPKPDSLALSDPLGDKGASFIPVPTSPVTFFGHSQGPGSDCWPRKPSVTPIDTVTPAGPLELPLPAPAAAAYNPPVGVTFAELVVLTSVCFEDEDAGAPEVDPVDTDHSGTANGADSNECGIGGDNAATNTQSWFVVHPS